MLSREKGFKDADEENDGQHIGIVPHGRLEIGRCGGVHTAQCDDEGQK